jgi:nucleoside-diphosphate-sugar epimerase
VIHHHACNIEKAKQLLNWTPKYTMDDVLKQTIDWFLESGAYEAL